MTLDLFRFAWPALLALASTHCTPLRSATDRRDVPAARDATNDFAAPDAPPAPDSAPPDAPPPDAPRDAGPPPDPSAIEPPRAIAPLSGSVVGTLTPVVRWALPTGAPTTAARVELCEDRACDRPIMNVAAIDGATSVALTVDAARRRLFWRLRGLAGTQPGSNVSPAWLLQIDVAPAANTLEQQSLRDVNNDGLADLMVGVPQQTTSGAPGSGRAMVFPGQAAAPGVATTPATQYHIDGHIPDRGASQLGAAVAIVGDMDGDGFSEMLAGAPCQPATGDPPSVTCGPGRARLEWGARVAPTTTVNLQGLNTAGERFGAAVAGLPDFNGDGLADAAIGAPRSGATGQGAVLLLRGAAGRTTSSGFWVPPSDGRVAMIGASVASAGDVNGDGLTDVIVGAPSTQGLIGAAFVVFGTAAWTSGAPPATIASIRLSPPGGTVGTGRYGFAVAGLGDIDRDGYADIAVGQPDLGAGSVYIYRGRSDAATGGALALITLAGTTAGERFGAALAGAGDVNGDGYADLVVGSNPPTDMANGVARVYLGGPAGLTGARPDVPVATLEPAPPPAGDPTAATTGKYGAAVAGAGDLNGDGFADVAVGAYLAPAFISPVGGSWITLGGRVMVYFGRATGFGTEPPLILRGETDQPGSGFGAALSRAWPARPALHGWGGAV